MAMRERHPKMPPWWHILLVLVLSWIVHIIYFVASTRVSPFSVIQWSIAQWIPWPLSSSIGNSLQEHAWNKWERGEAEGEINITLDVPVMDLSGEVHIDSLVQTLEANYGKDWRSRPLLLKGLWSRNDLEDENRRLSLHGLLKEDLSIPYFLNASAPYALSPDAVAPTSQIIKNMAIGQPHKIGSQLLVQTYPELIAEVAPTEIVTKLFGNHFQPEHVVGSGPLRLFPATTTVPVFVARTGNKATRSMKEANNEGETCTENASSKAHPRTDLHCEPIGNVAVQLRGEKRWLLVTPEYSFRIQPAAAPDGRAFFASFATSLGSIPQYHVTTKAGDALWIPTWTWHRVDYVSEASAEDVAIGGSLFHFRPLDFLRNNPLFALLVIPSLIKEVVGYNTQ